MNPLLQQFVEEGAELLETVEQGLLVLERDPTDADTLNAVFRAAHTFKGSSGLFDLVELTRLTHACEDVLDRARTGEVLVDGVVVDLLNDAFDLVRTWLAELAAHGVMPAGSGTAADGSIVALRGLLGHPAAVTPVLAAPVAAYVPDGVVAWRVAYRPDENAFFCGEDPVHLVAQIPDIVSIDPVLAAPWPAIDDLDEYAAVLGFDVVTRADRAELDHLFRFNAEEVTFTPITGGAEDAADEPTDDRPLRELVEAQHQLLRTPAVADTLPGRIRSAAGVLQRAVLRGAGAGTVTAADVTTAETLCLATGDAGALVALAERILAGGLATCDVTPAHIDALDTAAPDAAAASDTAAPASGAVANRPLKVDPAKVERLLELAGELVVAKNALPFLARAAEEIDGGDGLGRQIRDQYEAMTRLAAELQQAAMDIRMVPVSSAWQRFPRMVRDLARKLGKQVAFVTEGEQTRADKDVLELLADPLLHLVRNSLDHGIESPDVRVAAGKAPEGTLRLEARQEADSVLIAVVDDGRGMDPEALRRRAVQRGLVTDAEAAALDDERALELIFLPGFSTAETVSDVSGRGVGMDVVRATIAQLGGEIHLASVLGAGTTLTLRLPLTMSVVSVMTTSVGGQRFGVPLDLVQETVRVPRHTVSTVRGTPVIALRRGLVPVIDLAGALALGGGRGERRERGDIVAAVVRADGHDVALAVDRFHENVDVILKPLEGVMRGVPGYAGTALMGDGSVLLVLDVDEVVRGAAAR